MKVEFIDSHTHLSAAEFDADRAEVVSRAQSAGISTLLNVGAGYGVQSAHTAVQHAEQFTQVFASVGLHPNDAAHPFDSTVLPPLAIHPRVVAIGETGLDFYWKRATREQQEQWFRHQIELAIDTKKPLIIHSREAGAECLRILKEYPIQRIGGVFHCYAENLAFAQMLREINFLISIPGTVTFKNATQVHEVARAIPLDQLMLETDAPFLAPHPNRGKRNESALMIETAKKIAELRAIPLEVLAEATSNNARRLFKFSPHENS